MPKWLGWVGIVLFVISFTPVGFIGFALGGLWIIIVSILLYVRGEPVSGAPAQPAVAPQS